MSKITTHVLDACNGVAAANVDVKLSFLTAGNSLQDDTKWDVLGVGYNLDYIR